MLRRINSLLLLLLLAPVLRAVPLTGFFSGPDGTGINGKLVLVLSNQSAVFGTPGTQIVGRSVAFPLSNGNLPPWAQVAANDIMQPRKTYYVAYVYDSSGALLAQQNYFIASSPSPFNFGQASPTTVTTNQVQYLDPADISLPNVWTGQQTFLLPVLDSNTLMGFGMVNGAYLGGGNGSNTAYVPLIGSQPGSSIVNLDPSASGVLVGSGTSGPSLSICYPCGLITANQVTLQANGTAIAGQLAAIAILGQSTPGTTTAGSVFINGGNGGLIPTAGQGGDVILSPGNGGIGGSAVSVAQSFNCTSRVSGCGFAHVRFPSCHTAAAAGATCGSAIIWPGGGFPDANYTIACSVADVAVSPRTGVPTVGWISSITTSGAVVNIVALTNAAAAGQVDCIGSHD